MAYANHECGTWRPAIEVLVSGRKEKRRKMVGEDGEQSEYIRRRKRE
jgi:hypothetical protein